MNIELRFYGPFRNLGVDAMELELAGPMTVAELRPALAARLRERHPERGEWRLVAESAIADDERILGDGETVRGGAKLSLLPPVSGG